MTLSKKSADAGCDTSSRIIKEVDRLLTIKEASELTGLAVGSLYHFVSAGRVSVIRFSRRCIRFRRSTLEQWFEELTQKRT
jgi:excisionase family DNA binding protein